MSGKAWKPKRGLGQAITRRRRQAAEDIRNQRQERINREKASARAEMDRARRAAVEHTKSDQTAWGIALLRAVVANQTAVMRAWALPQSVSFAATASPHVLAWTDFKQVRVEWPVKDVPQRLNRLGTLDIVARMKGVMQHEIGHIRYSTPFPEIYANAKMPRKYNEAQVKWTMNALEDQRMECLVVEKVPRIRFYFGTMVANIVLGGQAGLGVDDAWLIIAGRSYLPFDVLKQSADAFDAFCDTLGINDGALTWLSIVDRYKAADSAQKLVDATEDALDFLDKIARKMPAPMDNHDQQGKSGNDPKDSARQPGDLARMLAEAGKDKGKGEAGQGDMQDPAKAKGKGEAGDGEGEGEGKGKDSTRSLNRQNYGEEYKGEAHKSDGTRSADPFGGEGQANGGAGDEEWSDQDSLDSLTDALTDMAEQFTSEIREHGDVKEMAANAGEMKDREGLEEYQGTGEAMNADLVARSQTTARGIEEALNNFVTQNEPSWHYRQEVGVIDALHYRTKDVGDNHFRRYLQDDGLQGLDVHVSMLCDVSYSMQGGPMVALSEALYATGLACQNLGIGATFTLWSTPPHNFRVWSDGVPSAVVWPAMGGTDPTIALDDLETHNPEEAANHLVIIFTDGQWSHGFPSLQRWAGDNRTIVLVRYGRYDGAIQTDMGADRIVVIDNIAELPRHLTNCLIDVLSGKGQNGW